MPASSPLLDRSWSPPGEEVVKKGSGGDDPPAQRVQPVTGVMGMMTETPLPRGSFKQARSGSLFKFGDPPRGRFPKTL